MGKTIKGWMYQEEPDPENKIPEGQRKKQKFAPCTLPEQIVWGGSSLDNTLGEKSRKNLTDITHLVTPENYNDISFWRGNPGVTICSSRPENSALAPFEYGLILTTVVNMEVSQIFYTQAVGSIMRRSGDGNGWNGQANILGQNAWVMVGTGTNKAWHDANLQIKRGYLSNVRVPQASGDAMGGIDVHIDFGGAFLGRPVVMLTCGGGATTVAFTARVFSFDSGNSGCTIRLTNSWPSSAQSVHVYWLAIWV